MKRFELIFPVVVFAFLGVLLLLGAFVFDYGPVVMRFPYIVGGFTMVMSIVVFVIERRAGAAPEPSEPTTETPDQERHTPRQLLVAGLWLIGILPVVYLCGYLVGIPLYLLAYLRAHGEGWLLSLAISLAMLALIYFVFLKILLVPLPLMPFTAFD